MSWLSRDGVSAKLSATYRTAVEQAVLDGFSLGKGFPRLRVIALSGWPEVRQVALKDGVDAFVSKGDPAESLLQTLWAITESTKGGPPE